MLNTVHIIAGCPSTGKTLYRTTNKHLRTLPFIDIADLVKMGISETEKRYDVALSLLTNISAFGISDEIVIEGVLYPGFETTKRLINHLRLLNPLVVINISIIKPLSYKEFNMQLYKKVKNETWRNKKQKEDFIKDTIYLYTLFEGQINAYRHLGFIDKTRKISNTVFNILYLRM